MMDDIKGQFRRMLSFFWTVFSVFSFSKASASLLYSLLTLCLCKVSCRFFNKKIMYERYIDPYIDKHTRCVDKHTGSQMQATKTASPKADITKQGKKYGNLWPFVKDKRISATRKWKWKMKEKPKSRDKVNLPI